MNKRNISLSEYCKEMGIDKEKVYIGNMTESKDFPNVFGYKDEIIIDMDYVKQMCQGSKLDELMQEIITCMKEKPL